ncbi:MAG TPA: MASE4 domain-containing protein [Gammaproteobacteria bacterium]|nr:MASE4 domain-containing protein [Gammaproteobacteria bacterium]
MTAQGERYDSRLSVASVPATARHKKAALAFSIGVLVAFAAIAPFALVPLPRSDGFIPALQAIVAVTDFITAVLLFAQYATDRSRALLVLAGGYLFAALIVVAHTFTFPGAFTPSGMFGAGQQTAAWLYVVWHVGYPAAVIAYVLLKRPPAATDGAAVAPTTATRWTVVVVVTAVAVLTWAAIAGNDLLPALVVSERSFATAAKVVTGVALLASVVAFVLLWNRRTSVLDEWLIVAVSASIAETTLVAVVGASRYTVAFYVGKPFAVVASCAVLVALLSEMTSLYVRLSLAVRALQRERASQVLNLDLIVGSIAHQVKQPLTVITTCNTIVANLLRHAKIDVGKVQLNVDDMARAGMSVADTIDSMRTLLKNPNEAQRQLDVNEVALEALQALSAELSDHDVQVRAELATGLPSVVGHRGQLREVLVNIMHNAIEAMATLTHDRPRRLRIATGRATRDRVSLAIEDSGPGIEPARLPTLFSAFVTTKANGMGLGLGICQLIVSRHNGELTASSQIGVGTRFEVVLPVASLAAEEASRVAASPIKAEA